MTVRDLYSICKAIHGSPAKVLALLDDDVCLGNENQERVYGYLQQYIGNMDEDEIRNFLRFVTGSAVCSAKVISVTFNAADGLARRPIGHTCTDTLELSSTYFSYMKFVSEFRSVLNSELSWKMDAV